MASITVQLDHGVEARLTELADKLHQSPAELAAEVIASYLAHDRWERGQIRKGMAELETGQGIPDEQVAAWLASWGTEEELPAPR